MSIAKQLQRIERLVALDRAQAQVEADIALRSAASARAKNALRAGIAALGLDTTVRFL